MVWLNAEELTRKFPALEFQSEFAELFGLSMVIRSRLSSPTYTFPDSLGLAIALTDEGKKWFDYIRTKYVESELSTTAIKVGLFTRFCHQDLLIDIDATSAKEIANELSFEIVGGKITYPWVLDRLLYDRFFTTFPNKTSQLNYDETMNLLHGTPKGIFQVGHFLIGPLGILDAIQPRYMEPIMTAPLWHCSDISCNALHTVHLASGQPALPLAVSQAVTYFRSAEGNAAEWGGYYAAARGRKTSYYDDLNTDTLPWLLANAFADSEITKISHDLLLKHSKDLRERFPTVRKLSTFR